MIQHFYLYPGLCFTTNTININLISILVESINKKYMVLPWKLSNEKMYTCIS